MIYYFGTFYYIILFLKEENIELNSFDINKKLNILMMVIILPFLIQLFNLSNLILIIFEISSISKLLKSFEFIFIK